MLMLTVNITGGKVNSEFPGIHHGKKLGFWPVTEEYYSFVSLLRKNIGLLCQVFKLLPVATFCCVALL